jgi:hypothetical protein
MGFNDVLKAALEKKRSQNKKTDGKNVKDSDKGIHGSQVSVNKPAKKSAGRGR